MCTGAVGSEGIRLEWGGQRVQKLPSLWSFVQHSLHGASVDSMPVSIMGYWSHGTTVTSVRVCPPETKWVPNLAALGAPGSSWKSQIVKPNTNISQDTELPWGRNCHRPKRAWYYMFVVGGAGRGRWRAGGEGAGAFSPSNPSKFHPGLLTSGLAA